jgi:hypothetical protein
VVLVFPRPLFRRITSGREIEEKERKTMLTSEPKKFDVPHEPGQWMMLRALSWKQLKSARRERSRELKNEMKELGAEIIAAYAKGGSDKEAARDLLKDMKYEESQFDTQVILDYGITEWSYDAEKNMETIGLLDERTAVWAKERIIDLTKPPTEEEQKNYSGVSTAT